MPSAEQKEHKKMKRMVAAANMVPNLLWTALFLGPAAVFCYQFIAFKTILLLLGFSLLPVFFPNSFFDKMQVSRSAGWYIKIGVKHINRFTQNGSMLNKWIRKNYPGFKIISASKASVRKQYYQTYFFEKFHFSLLLFFIVITIYAAVQNRFWWAVVLMFCNVFYNVYPNLLQQYIRLKLKSAVK